MASDVNSGTASRNVIRDRQIIDETLYFIAQRGWTASDGDFLTSLVKYLATELDVAHAFVGKTIGTPPEGIETVALFSGGKIRDNISYSLKGTPCENVTGDTMCCYVRDIQSEFPEDILLAEMGADSYIGIPLWDSHAQPIGIIALLDNKPMENAGLAQTLLQIVAVRAAAELERRLSDLQIKINQQQMQATFDNAGIGIAHVSPEGRFLRANRKLCSMLGYSAEEITQKTVQDLTHPDDLEKSLISMRQALEAPEHLRGYSREKRYVAASGRTVWSLITVTLLRDETGEPDYFVTVVEDISHRKRHEEQLRQARDEAERANRAKSTFLANMSHELRTPLNAILGFAEMMDEQIHGEIPPKYRDYASHIRKSGRHLLDLINEILDLSRIEMGKLELDVGDYDLPVLGQEVLDLLAMRAQMASVELELQVQPDEFPIVKMDRTRTQQILTNLVHNAIKFSPKGKVTLQMTADKSQIRIDVTDTGIGMSEQDIAVALSLFGQVNNDYLSKSAEGTGLGLPLAKQLVELQGGRLEITSIPSKGTTVTAIFPIAAVT